MNEIDEQQKQFEEVQEMIPKVEHVMNEHANILTGQEERWLYEYLQFLTDKSDKCPRTIVEKATTIVEYLGRV